MNFVTYLINLDRAPMRRAYMEEQLNRYQLPFTRIAAVSGDALVEPIKGFNERAYHLRTGKQKNKNEIGCYFSHLKVMETFLGSDAQYALVLEDDAQLPPELSALLKATIAHRECWDLLRLSSSRKGEYKVLVGLDSTYQLAINFKVLKNTAAYLINRRAAAACVKNMQPMRQPYDVALDRDWAIGFKTACIVPFPVKLSDHEGQISKAPRIRLFRSTTFHLFHFIDRVRRRRWRKRVFEQAKSETNPSA